MVPPVGLTDLTVLLANDDPDQLEFLRTLVERAGGAPLCAGDGVGALDLARTHRPDVIVSDVLMPRMDGMALCRAIRGDAELWDTPLLLVSAVYRDDATAVQGIQAGADDYVEIPFDPPRLLAKIQRLGAKRRADQESQGQLRALLSALGDFVFVIDAHGRYLRVAPTRADLPYQLTSDLVGRSLHDVLPPAQADMFLERIRTVLAERTAQLVEYSYTLNGELRWFEGSIAATTADEVVWVARDVTERRTLREQLLHAQRMEAIGQLAGGIAHDFNTHLFAIVGHAELLAEALPAGSQTRQDAEAVLEAAARATALTRQLLAFGRKQPTSRVPLDLNAVVTGIVSMCRRLIGPRIDLRTELTPVAGPVHADRGQVEQVLMNLVVNARDAMPGGGSLTIRTRPEPRAPGSGAITDGSGYVVLSVGDTGIGMDERVRARIFEPFFTTKDEGRGTGLGLPMVARIVQESGGHIRVTSEPGRGTTMEVYFPHRESAVP